MGQPLSPASWDTELGGEAGRMGLERAERTPLCSQSMFGRVLQRLLRPKSNGLMIAQGKERLSRLSRDQPHVPEQTQQTEQQKRMSQDLPEASQARGRKDPVCCHDFRNSQGRRRCSPVGKASWAENTGFKYLQNNGRPELGKQHIFTWSPCIFGEQFQGSSLVQGKLLTHSVTLPGEGCGQSQLCECATSAVTQRPTHGSGLHCHCLEILHSD